MKKYFKKGFVLLCSVAILLAPFFSACGKKAPPKPPVEKSQEQGKKVKSNSVEH